MLQPFIFKRTVNVPPLAVIVAILAGSSLLGVVGALVAIPIAAALQIVLQGVLRRPDHGLGHASSCPTRCRRPTAAAEAAAPAAAAAVEAEADEAQA